MSSKNNNIKNSRLLQQSLEFSRSNQDSSFVIKNERDDLLSNFINKSQIGVPGPIYKNELEWLKEVKGQYKEHTILKPKNKFRIPGPNKYYTNQNMDQNLEFEFGIANRFVEPKISQSIQLPLQTIPKTVEVSQPKILPGGVFSRTGHNLVYDSNESPGPKYNIREKLNSKTTVIKPVEFNTNSEEIPKKFYEITGGLFQGQKKSFAPKLPLIHMPIMGKDSPGPAGYSLIETYVEPIQYSKIRESQNQVETLRNRFNEQPRVPIRRDKRWKFYEKDFDWNDKGFKIGQGKRDKQILNDNPGVGSYNILKDNFAKIVKKKQKNQKEKRVNSATIIRNDKDDKEFHKQDPLELQTQQKIPLSPQGQTHQKKWLFSVGERKLNYFGQEISLDKRNVSPGPIYLLEQKFSQKLGNIGKATKKTIFEENNKNPGPNYNPPSSFKSKKLPKRKKSLIMKQSGTKNSPKNVNKSATSPKNISKSALSPKNTNKSVINSEILKDPRLQIKLQ